MYCCFHEQPSAARPGRDTIHNHWQTAVKHAEGHGLTGYFQRGTKCLQPSWPMPQLLKDKVTRSTSGDYHEILLSLLSLLTT